MGHAWADALRLSLKAQADPARAPAMQAYMKSTMPFLGIAAPQLGRIVSDAVKAAPLSSTAELGAVMADLWRHAQWREERYAAIDLPVCGRVHRRLLTLECLPLVEEMISTGAWWDWVDELSGNVLSELVQRHHDDMAPVLRRWAKSDDMWLRRAAMLCQRKFRGEAFDAALFYETILPSVGPKARFANEFFIRKGIGWALRERSYAAPAEVEAFCDEYSSQLAPLTQREALRVIAKRRKG
jgi:3-methyladenine DNA glycosylase AlkD